VHSVHQFCRDHRLAAAARVVAERHWQTCELLIL